MDFRLRYYPRHRTCNCKIAHTIFNHLRPFNYLRPHLCFFTSFARRRPTVRTIVITHPADPSSVLSCSPLDHYPRKAQHSAPGTPAQRAGYSEMSWVGVIVGRYYRWLTILGANNFFAQHVEFLTMGKAVHNKIPRYLQLLLIAHFASPSPAPQSRYYM